MDTMAIKLACLRLAPVQVAAWGHPETTGLPTLDYFLSAEDLDPPGAQECYTERLIRLPHLGCFYSPQDVAGLDPDLEALGIDKSAPVLLCPGVPFKYAAEHDAVFPAIARLLGRCRFIFFIHQTRGLSETLAGRLRTVFAKAGLDANEFVVFIPWQTREAFHGLMKRADVFLDTIGFSGFNTAMQAVECGLPVVTREGRFLRGRLASGILKRMGLHELVAATEDEYVSLAAKLCQDAAHRARVRARIEQSRDVLFEDEAPIRALEDFLVEAVRQAR
jgi:predicted O-linked N-acetylglucosamine transferase (SPINDLY family)